MWSNDCRLRLWKLTRKIPPDFAEPVEPETLGSSSAQTAPATTELRRERRFTWLSGHARPLCGLRLGAGVHVLVAAALVLELLLDQRRFRLHRPWQLRVSETGQHESAERARGERQRDQEGGEASTRGTLRAH